ncbi:MAG: VWA domain-containing protein [Acetivibrio ethanolgignens]
MRMEQLWPLDFLILLPFIVLLYILKEKAEDRRVSSLYLWQEAYRSLEARTPWEKLKNNLLLYLQLALTLLLILTLCGPYLNRGQRAWQDVVIALDTSGSMNSIYYEEGKATERTRLEEAKERAIRYVDSLPMDTRVTLVTASQNAELVFTRKTDRYSIKEELRGIKGSDLPGNLSFAADLVKAMSAQWESCQTVFFTDETVDTKGLLAVTEYMGSPGANLSVTQVSHRELENGKSDILVRVENTGGTEMASDVNLYLDESLEQIQSVRLKPGEHTVLYFRNVYVKESVAAELNEADDLDSDNIAYDCIREREAQMILLASEKNVFLEKALMNLENVEVYKTNDITGLEQELDFDFYVFDGMLPEKLPQKGSLFFINPKKSIDGLFTIEGEAEGVWVEEKGTEFGFSVSTLKKIKTPGWAKAFYQAGEYGAGFSGEKNGRRITVLAFDVHGSEWPLLPEFPLKIYELGREGLETGLLSENKITAGGKVSIYGQNGTWTYTDTEKTGFKRIKDGEEQELLAVNFPDAESRVWKSLSAADAGDKDGKAGENRLSAGLPLRRLFLFLGFCLLAVEGMVYFRQDTFGLRSRRQKTAILLLRGLVVICLLLAWSNPSFVLGKQPSATVFLVDVSDSVAGREIEAVAFVKEAIDALPEREQSGVIAFGKEAHIEQFMNEKRLFSELETVVTSSATNLNRAVATALGMFPDNAPKRLVLLTDGKETEGSIEEFSTLLKEKKIQLAVKKWENAGTAEVSVDSVVVPNKVSIKDSFKVSIRIQSNVETGAVLSLYAGNEKKAEKQLKLQKGSNQFVFTDRQTAPGLKSYRVIIEPDVDSITINNEYCAYTQAESPETILFIEGKPGQGDEFARLLTAANISYQRMVPQAAPRTLMELLAYRSVFLLDVYAPDLPEGFFNNIEAYVRDYGGGLAAIGGSNSFALGGYRDTPLESVLPVDMDLKGEKEIPKMAMVMVIDRSGSMSAGDGRVTQLTLAKEAAAEALGSLRQEDEVGVIAFESTYDWVVKLTSAEDTETIEERIASIGLGGGTSIYPAIEAAEKALAGSDAKRKHIILLTDGQDGYQGYDELLSRLSEEEISLSTVAVGEASDQELLNYLAREGNGRSYYTDIHSDIPRIFAQEVFLAARDYLVNRKFTPVITSNSGLIREAVADGVPPLHGYVAASPKDRAQVHLESDTEDPLYATWQYGLGRTAAFLSDGENNWTKAWASWEGYPLLIKQLVNWTMADTADGKNRLETIQKGNGLKISYELAEYTEGSTAEVVLTDEDGEQKTLELSQTKPGSFEGEITLEKTGIYGINVRQKENGSIMESRNTAAALQYSEEYRLLEDIAAFEAFVESNEGRYVDTPSQAVEHKPESVKARTSLGNLFLILAILFFALDIIIRRFRLPERKKKPTLPPERKRSGKEKQEVRLNTAQLLQKKEDRKG